KNGRRTYADSQYLVVALGAPEEIVVFPDAKVHAPERSVPGNADLPQSLLQYVIRTGESVILNDVEQDRVYREDNYIRRANPRSLLCMPIRARGEMTGILYLENDLVPGAFTEERLEVLGILSAQAAVSLENAILYDDLEQRVVERTAELGATLKRVQELKVAQDCDYYLTALLIQPLSATAVESASIEIRSLLRQKKRFRYKKWSEQIGGDINVARSIRLQGRTCTVFFQGDAMGKSLQGAGGALVFGAVVESLIAGTGVNVETAALEPAVWLMRSFQELHRVFESFRGYMLMSVMLGVIEDDTGRTHMINGDHPPAVLYRAGRANFLDQIPITHKLGAHWYRREVVNHELQLQEGDTLIVGSDGRDDLMIEGGDAGEELMNEDPALFLKRVEEGRGVVEDIYEAIRRSGEIKDDLSLMSIAYQDSSTGPGRRDSLEARSDPTSLNT
ncbi:MAG: SpoIIE family protein phosphatase, partial [Leptospirales bacterium]